MQLIRTPAAAHRYGFHKAFNDVIDGSADHAARCVLIREDTRDQVKEPLSAMKGSEARTKLIWPMPLALIEFAHCSSVVS